MIHKFQNNGYSIVLDVHSGAVHVVDPCAYAMVDLLDETMGEVCPAEVRAALSANFSEEEIEDTYEELWELKEQGLLFSPDDYAQFADRMVSSPLKAMCLHVSHDCNLRCKYCFAGQGLYGGQAQIMPFEVAKAAIDFLIDKSVGRHNLELDFFGGEPLLNWDVVKKTVAYARSLEKEHHKNFRFTMTTNGVLLNQEINEYLNREMHNVVLSLDGRREINDAMRPNAGGKGSYDTIVPQYQEFVKMRGDKDYYVRGTFTRNNLDFTEDVLHMVELGFDQVSVEPVISDPALSFSIQEEDLPRVFEEYDRLALEILAAQKGGTGLQFFPLHAGFGSGALCHQAAAGLRLRQRIRRGGSGGRGVSLPSVCRTAGMADGPCTHRRIRFTAQGVVCPRHGLQQGQMPGLLGKILLLRRLQRQ